MTEIFVLLVIAVYLCLLFAVASFVDRNVVGRLGWVCQPWIYALSITVYCTSWTYYGSVGRASVDGIDFLAIYLGPVAVFILGYPVLRHMVGVTRRLHITSIADFLSVRYGRSRLMAGLVTLIAVIGILPYISLQLKAVSSSITLLAAYPVVGGAVSALRPFWLDSGFFTAVVMALFCIVLGTRRIDASEQHGGLMTAVAIESVVKLVAFLAVGIFVVVWMFDGPSALFSRAAGNPALAGLLNVGERLQGLDFWVLVLLSSMAIICLPRQFQVIFVENTDQSHLARARWVFPLYLGAINLFVLPLALAGSLFFSNHEVAADTFVLSLPIAAGERGLALLAFIGGVSAATSMMLVETIALSTMVCNDLVMPVLLPWMLGRPEWQGRPDFGWMIKRVRRGAVIAVLLLAYGYVRLIGDSYALVSIGLLSFVAAAQFAPPIMGGLFWRQGSRTGALIGLSLGFVTWGYTLLLPSFVRSGWLPAELLSLGPFGFTALRPTELFQMADFSELTRGTLWSLGLNLAGYLLGSLVVPPRPSERFQALGFFESDDRRGAQRLVWGGLTTIGDLVTLAGRFVGRERAEAAAIRHFQALNRPYHREDSANGELVALVERLVAGAIGAASARVVLASTLKTPAITAEDMIEILGDASEAIELNLTRLRDAIDNIDQGIVMFDADLRLVVWNHRFIELIDVPEAMIQPGMSLETIFRYNAERGEYGLEDVETVVAERLARARRAELHRVERERPNGMVLEIAGRPLPSGGFVSTYTDVTHRRQAEAALRAAYDSAERLVDERTRDLRRSEQRFRALAELASDWIWETDADLRYTFLSERFSQAVGVSPAEVLGKTVRAWHEPAIALEGERWARLFEDIAARRSFRDFQYRVPRVQGGDLVLRVTGAPYFDGDGAFLGYRGTGANVTEMVEAEVGLMRSEKLAALGGLVAGIAHEINTPVGTCLTGASLLEDQTRVLQRLYDASNSHWPV